MFPRDTLTLGIGTIGLILLCQVAVNVDAFSKSVPQVRSVCKTMVPGHEKIEPKPGAGSPFSVKSDLKEVKSGESIEITLSGKDGRQFKGFYIQVRDEKGLPIGTFVERTNVKTHNCEGQKSNAAHHVNPEEKSSIQVSWKAPAGYKGTVKIQATAVENYTTIWTPIFSQSITVK